MSKSAGFALVLLGMFSIGLSPVLYLWAVPREEQAFRKTGKSESTFVKKGTHFDITLNPSDFGVDYSRGERLALAISASENMLIMIFYEGSAASVVITYPPTGVGVQDGKIVFFDERNVPLTQTLDQPGPALVRFSSSDKDMSVTYEVLVSFKAVKILYPLRESNTYLVSASLGLIAVLLGIYRSRSGFSKSNSLRKITPPSSWTEHSTDISQQVTETKRCQYCGVEIPRDSVYCQTCGKRVPDQYSAR